MTSNRVRAGWKRRSLNGRRFLIEGLDKIEFRTRINQFGMFKEHENNVVLNENSVEGKP